MAPGSGCDFNCTWEQCVKSFKRKSDLCRHYRIHTNERPYRCTVKNCNKSFIQRSALTVHSRTHTGEKPHVCDHEGCQKAFSDSSSLARHRRIHTGKRPYICQEPTCERSFCRKTTLTKHQHRSHPPGSMTRPSSEDATSEHSYHQHQPPVTVSIPNPNDHHLIQHSYYQNSSTPIHEFYSPQSVPMGTVPVHDGAAPIVPPDVLVTSPMNLPHAPPHHPSHPQLSPQQQQYMQMMQQQQALHDATMRTNYLPLESQHPPPPPPPCQGHQMPEGMGMMVSYRPHFQYKLSQVRLLNQL